MATNNSTNNVDFSKIVPDFLNSVISVIDRNNIVEVAKIERLALQRKFGYSESFSNEHVKRRASEIAFNSSRHAELTFAKKAILASNIAFDKNKFVQKINSLRGSCFGFHNLTQFIRLASYFSIKGDLEHMSIFDNALYKNFILFNRLISNEFLSEFGKVDSHLIINMLNEIISFEPELLCSYNKDVISR